MSRATLLIEIGCEEIPARMLPQAARDVVAVVVELLDRAGLSHGEAQPLWTPRRLSVLIPEVENATAARAEQVLGPPASAAFGSDGKPTKAVEGWAKKQGLDLSQVVRVVTDKGDYAGANITRASRSVGEVLAAGFEKGVASISFPKTMRWTNGEFLFVRPVHWLVAMCGDELLPLTLFGVAAGRQTRGHRGLSPGPHEVISADTYLATLQQARVMADPRRRKHALHEALEAAARNEGGALVEDEELLDESCDIVEWPGALCGAFESRYVSDVPAGVLSTCLRHHQKAFSVADSSGRLMPRFAVAINMPGDPERHIRRGHEWVVTGRLADALFFWGEDRKQTLAARAPRLEGIVFHRDLGTFAQKTRRVQRLAGQLALERSDLSTIDRSAQLSRCDLVTGLVGEFPEIQGIVGGLLARADGEPAEVFEAIAALYLPSGPDDSLPSTVAGRVLGIADRLDTLAGGFGVGLQPTGSKDPFGLRRAGTALIRLALDDVGLDLIPWCRAALLGYDGTDGPDLRDKANDLLPALTAFLFERFETVASRVVDGVRYDELAAVKGFAQQQFDAADLVARLAAMYRFRASADFLALAAAAKRVRNILDQARERGEAIDGASPDLAVLQAAEERDLHEAIGICQQQAAQARDSKRYEDALSAIAALRPAVDRFFDKILVMDPDQEKRRARLSMLAALEAQATSVVDISQIVVEGK